MSEMDVSAAPRSEDRKRKCLALIYCVVHPRARGRRIRRSKRRRLHPPRGSHPLKGPLLRPSAARFLGIGLQWAIDFHPIPVAQRRIQWHEPGKDTDPITTQFDVGKIAQYAA